MRTLPNFSAAVSLLALGYLAVNFLGARLYQTLETQRFVRQRKAEARFLSGKTTRSS